MCCVLNSTSPTLVSFKKTLLGDCFILFLYKVVVFSSVSSICIKLGTDCFLEPLKEMSFLHSPENRDENQFPLSWLPKGFRALKQYLPPISCKHSLPRWTQCVDLSKKREQHLSFCHLFHSPGWFCFPIRLLHLVSPACVKQKALVRCACLFVSKASQFK